jgi:hypothetical protein
MRQTYDQLTQNLAERLCWARWRDGRIREWPGACLASRRSIGSPAESGPRLPGIPPGLAIFLPGLGRGEDAHLLPPEGSRPVILGAHPEVVLAHPGFLLSYQGETPVYWVHCSSSKILGNYSTRFE